MKTLKEYENIDKLCEECIFEHEHEPLTEAEYQELLDSLESTKIDLKATQQILDKSS